MNFPGSTRKLPSMLLLCVCASFSCSSFPRIGECRVLVRLGNEGLNEVLEVKRRVDAQPPGAPEYYDRASQVLTNTARRLEQATVHDKELADAFRRVVRSLQEASRQSSQYRRALERRSQTTHETARQVVDKELSSVRKRMDRVLNQHSANVRRVNAICQPSAR